MKSTSTSRFVVINGKLVDVRLMAAGQPASIHKRVPDPDNPAVVREVSLFARPVRPITEQPLSLAIRRPENKVGLWRWIQRYLP